MKKALLRLGALACALATPLSAQGPVQQIGPVTSGHVAAWWQNGQVYDGGAVPLPNVANTWTAKQTFGPGTTNASPIAILPGVAPTNAINGDIWTQTNGIYGRFNGVTQGPYTYPGGAYNWTAEQTFATSTTGSASINIPQGATPGSPSNGDVWATSSGLFTQIGGATYNLLIPAAANVTFSQVPSPSYAAGTLGLHSQNDLYAQDAPYGALGDGTTDSSAAWASAIAKAQAGLRSVQGTPGSIYRFNSGLSVTGNAFSLVGADNAPVQNTALPSVTFRGFGSGALLSLTGTGDVLKNFALENYGSHTYGVNFSTGGHHQMDGVSVIGNGGSPFSTAAFHTSASAFGYSDFRHLAMDGGGAPVGFLAENNSNPNNPIVVRESREFSAYAGKPFTLFKFDGASAKSVNIYTSTFNQYGSLLQIFNAANSNGLVDFPSNSAFKVVGTDASEIDISTSVSSDRIYNVANVAAFSVTNSPIDLGGSATAMVDLYNSTARFGGNTVTSLNGPLANITDLESHVIVDSGNSLNKTNTNGYFNSAVTLPSCSFTANTNSASYDITVTATSCTIYPGEALSGAGITAGTVVREQESGTKGGTGVYRLYQLPSATNTGVTLSQAGGLTVTNSGVQTVPLLVQGGTNYYYIEERYLDAGVTAFRIDYDTSMAGKNIDIEVAKSTDNPAVFPISGRRKGAIIRLIIRNSSGGAMGTVTYGSGFKVSASVSKPTDGNTMTIGFIQDAKISGGVANDVFVQFDKEVADIPN